jgi:hypothetical protein
MCIIDATQHNRRATKPIKNIGLTIRYALVNCQKGKIAMELIDFLQAGLFSIGVLLFALAGGCLFMMLTVKKEHVKCVVEKRIEFGFFGGACLTFLGLITYVLA